MRTKFVMFETSGARQNVYLRASQVIAVIFTGDNQSTIYVDGRSAPVHVDMNAHKVVQMIEENEHGDQVAA